MMLLRLMSIVILGLTLMVIWSQHRSSEAILTAARTTTMPQSESFNRFFDHIAERCDVVMPYRFVAGTVYNQEAVDANFDAVIEAIDEGRCK